MRTICLAALAGLALIQNTPVALAGNDISKVNGSIWLGKGAQVEGSLTNVNGKLSLDAAQVGGGLETTNGDIDVGAGSHVKGGILVEKPSFSLFRWHSRNPKIVIGADTIVEGTLRFEREVDLYVSDRAKIGRVEGATPVMFPGDDPHDRRAQQPSDTDVER